MDPVVMTKTMIAIPSMLLLFAAVACSEDAPVALDDGDGSVPPTDAGAVDSSVRGDATVGEDGASARCSTAGMTELVDVSELGPTSPTWNRPSTASACPTQETTTEVPYATYTFCNDGPAARFDIVVEGDTVEYTLQDPVVFVYEGDAIPEDETLCIGSDSASFQIDGPYSARVEGLAIDEGETVTVVVTAFLRSGSYGSYRLSIAPSP